MSGSRLWLFVDDVTGSRLWLFVQALISDGKYGVIDQTVCLCLVCESLSLRLPRRLDFGYVSVYVPVFISACMFIMLLSIVLQCLAKCECFFLKKKNKLEHKCEMKCLHEGWNNVQFNRFFSLYLEGRIQVN